ncbi:15353_t:CDS:2, partial [Gigaspora rosea]
YEDNIELGSVSWSHQISGHFSLSISGDLRKGLLFADLRTTPYFDFDKNVTTFKGAKRWLLSLITLSDFAVDVAVVGGGFCHWLVVNFLPSLSLFLMVKFRRCDIACSDLSPLVQLLDFTASVVANVAIAWDEFRR